MTNNRETNSINYWQDRFSNDWLESHGDEQSMFFMKLTLSNLPEWLINQIQENNFSIVDWGCASGGGTNFLGNYFKNELINGVDFSENAIELASNNYKGIDFHTENWLSDPSKNKYDVLFSSNTLEHFHKPYETLQKLIKNINNIAILTLPFNETVRIKEHFFTFTKENVPFQIKENFELIFSKTVKLSKDNQHWPGEQIILVYANMNWFRGLNPNLNKLSINHIDYETDNVELKNLNIDLENKIIDLENKIKKANADFEEKLHQINLNHKKLIQKQDNDYNDKIDALLLNNKIASNQKEVTNQLEYDKYLLEQKIFEIYNSTSWKLSSPIRKSKKLTYNTAKFFYKFLPLSIRNKLLYNKNIVKIAKNPSQNNSKPLKVGLSWDEFNSKILSNRDKYKGIFISECIIYWDVPLYQRPQHLATAFAELGYLVIYRTFGTESLNIEGFYQEKENLWITSCKEVDNIKGAVRSFYSTASIHSVDYIKQLKKHNTIVYEYIDHIDPKISGDDVTVNKLFEFKNACFNGLADYIVPSAQQLYSESLELFSDKSKVKLIPNGVDIGHYKDEKHKTFPLPENIKSFRSKYSCIIGYFGAMAPWLWYDVINELTDKHPEIGFIFIGPDYAESIQKLEIKENVLTTGAIDYKVLPAYAALFDICFIPFEPGEIAKTTSPLKLFEYFALEKPIIVTSDMKECVAYKEVFNGGNLDELTNAINKAKAKINDMEYKQKLAHLAKQNSWEKRATVYSEIFDSIN